jgi:hypothetical protein
VEGSMKHYKEPMTKPRRLGREWRLSKLLHGSSGSLPGINSH